MSRPHGPKSASRCAELARTRPLRIALQVDGGLASFPGLRRPVTVDSGSLSPGQAAQLCELIDRSDFFGVSPPHRSDAPDARTYTVEIEDGPRRRTLRLTEPIADPALRELVSSIRSCVPRDGKP
jgi:emfourin